ncbi:NUDIX hydrolase [Kineococcus sp. SYSU DK006]|uniref:NUDIX hydrolase n=1 Tax=Kineococcus sp. SYSU DK006 TaxID=3383127 RepID=UPI003D7DBBD0
MKPLREAAAGAPPAPTGSGPVDVEAAGCVVVRPARGGAAGGDAAGGAVEVLLVHRPRTATRAPDWSWPKGKLDEQEHPAVAAVRETAEETGVRVHLGVPLPEQRYAVSGGRRKRVRYWLARPVPAGRGGGPDPAPDPVLDVEPAGPEEVDETAWVSPQRARELLTYPDDADLLAAALPGDALPPPTWPLVVLRHARAVKRADWAGEEGVRPLLERGHAQSRALAPLLVCFDVRSLVTSPWARCVQTVLPAAELAAAPVVVEDPLTEAAHARDPRAAADVVAGLLAEGGGVVVCSHGPVLPTLQAVVAAHAGTEQVRGALTGRLAKGELVVAHVSGRGSAARVVAAERHAC